MSNSPDDLIPKQALRNMQIVAGALLAGVLVFAIVVVILIQRLKQGPVWAGVFGYPILTWMAWAALMIWLPVSFVISKRMTKKSLSRIINGVDEPAPRKVLPTTLQGAVFWLIAKYIEQTMAARGVTRPDKFSLVERILLARQATIVLAFATLEGIGFFANFAYLFEGRLWALVVTGIVIFLMIWMFPTAERTRAWILQQAEEIEQLQRAGNTGAT